MFGPPHDRRRGADRPLAYAVTLTCRSGDESEIRAKLADFVRVVGKRAPKVGLLCALDRAPSGAWHVHALALLPPTLTGVFAGRASTTALHFSRRLKRTR